MFRNCMKPIVHRILCICFVLKMCTCYCFFCRDQLSTASAVSLAVYFCNHTDSLSVTRCFLFSFECLSFRVNVELCFSCYHVDDKSQSTDWPLGIRSVHVNGRVFTIERGAKHQPIHLKNAVAVGNNQLQIFSMDACICVSNVAKFHYDSYETVSN